VTDFDRIPIEDYGLVTASALLDLVALDWLQSLVRRCSPCGACLHFALTYDGHFSFVPSVAEDLLIKQLVNQHQAGDKGFGAALGPYASTEALALLANHGYQISTFESPWCLDPRDSEVQYSLLRDWAQAATEMAPELSARIKDWRQNRERLVAEGKSSLKVGHSDLLAIPAPD
jgi:hypothetical protein